MRHCQQFLIILYLTLTLPLSLFGDWNLIEPPGNGLMRSAVINQNNEILSLGLNTSTYYCSAPFENWIETRTNDGTPVRRVAATGDKLFGLNHESSSGQGAFYTSDDWGQTWNHLATTKITPSYNDVLLFKAFGDTLVIASKDSLYYSVDSGNTWINWMEGIDTYFRAGDMVRTKNHIYVMSGTIHRADGFGLPFKEMKTGFNQQSEYRLQTDKDRIYALSYNSVFYTTDNDTSWTQVTMGDFPSFASESFYVNNDDIFVLIYKGKTGFYHAKAGDSSWATLDLGLPKYSLQHITGNDNYLVVSSDAGIFISGDRGLSWHSALNGLPQVSREIIDIKKDKNDICVMNLDGIYRTHDGGTSWDYTGGGLTTKARSLLNVHDTLFAIGSTGSGNFDSNYLLRKVHPDSNWIKPVETIGGWTERLFRIIRYEKKLYVASTNGIFVSADMGNSWTDLNMDTTTYAFDLAFYKDQLYFYGRRNDGDYTLYRLNETKQIWEQLESDLHVESSNRLLTLEATNDYLFALTQKALFRFDATSGTWDSLHVGYDEADAMTTLLCSGDNIILGSSNGGYLSKDSGNSWEPVLEDGILENNPQLDFHDLAGDTVFVRAAERYGDNNAYWNTLQNITSIHSERNAPVEFNLAQNYPNPFNPSTVIRYSLSGNCEVDLTIYNILGQKVATLVNESQAAGTYSIQFNAGNLSAGMYFYTLKTSDGFSATRKLVLLK